MSMQILLNYFSTHSCTCILSGMEDSITSRVAINAASVHLYSISFDFLWIWSSMRWAFEVHSCKWRRGASLCQKVNTLRLPSDSLRPRDSCVHPQNVPEEKQRRKDTLGDRLTMLPGRKSVEKQRRKKSTLSDWLLMLPGREPGEKRRRMTSCQCCQGKNQVRSRGGRTAFLTTSCQCCQEKNQARSRGGTRALMVTGC